MINILAFITILALAFSFMLLMILIDQADEAAWQDAYMMKMTRFDLWLMNLVTWTFGSPWFYVVLVVDTTLVIATLGA